MDPIVRGDTGAEEFNAVADLVVRHLLHYFLQKLPPAFHHTQQKAFTLWRKPTLFSRPESVGGEAAEVGCGAGQCLIPVAMAFPKSRFFGYDVNQTSVERAREKPRAPGSATGYLSNEPRRRTFRFANVSTW